MTGDTPSEWQMRGVAIAAYTLAVIFVVVSNKYSLWLVNFIGVLKLLTLVLFVNPLRFMPLDTNNMERTASVSLALSSLVDTSTEFPIPRPTSATLSRVKHQMVMIWLVHSSALSSPTPDTGMPSTSSTRSRTPSPLSSETALFLCSLWPSFTCFATLPTSPSCPRRSLLRPARSPHPFSSPSCSEEAGPPPTCSTSSFF